MYTLTTAGTRKIKKSGRAIIIRGKYNTKTYSFLFISNYNFRHTARASSSAMSKCPTSCCVPCVSPCACRSSHSGASSKSPLVHVLHERSDFLRMIHCNIICSRSVMIRCPFITVRFSRDHHFAVRNFFVQTTSATEHNKLVRLDNRMCIFNRAHTCRRAHIRFVESKFFSFVFKLIDRRLRSEEHTSEL